MYVYIFYNFWNTLVRLGTAPTFREEIQARFLDRYPLSLLLIAPSKVNSKYIIHKQYTYTYLYIFQHFSDLKMADHRRIEKYVR